MYTLVTIIIVERVAEKIMHLRMLQLF